ncbi:MAG: FAD-binding protein, partial [Duncaniella sp.]|nr:FAD-binding protein [Duncaniella sp.]
MIAIPNTFALPAHAKRLIEIESVDHLRSLLPTLEGEPLLVVGAGSNLVFLGDWQGTVLHSAIRDITISDDGLTVAGSGVIMDDLIRQTAGHGLWGLENLSGIPGEVGASAVQNVGAYGTEAADTIVSVEAVDLTSGEIREFSAEECRFGYRDSIFKQDPHRDRYFITLVTYQLSHDATPTLSYPALKKAFGDSTPSSPLEVREKVISIRNEKLPDPAKVPSAGSFFKNPVVDAKVFERVRSLHPDREVPHYP